MARFEVATPLGVSARSLWDWHMREGVFRRLTPPWERVRMVASSWPPSEGSKATLELRVGPFRQRWVAVHEGFVEGEQFCDRQERGPFAAWIHRHRFEELDADRALLRDSIDYRLPFEPPGRWFGGGLVRGKLERMFAYRHAVTRWDLRRHARFAHIPPLKIAVSGASGMVGSALTAFLEAGGHRVFPIVRRAATDEREIAWDPAAERFDEERLRAMDAVVHLAGENIAAGRWNAERKRRIRDSRVQGTGALARALAGLDSGPRVWVSASAIGFYGDRGDEVLDEESAPGTGFLPETCQAWEEACAPAEEAGLRVVKLRIGIVQAAAGGALARTVLPFRLGLGGRFGNGRQGVSWIALDDLVGAIHHALLDDTLRGPVNATAPTPVSQAESTRVLARVLRRPAFMHVPAPAVRLLLGEMGQDLLLSGARVMPRRLEQAGFEFRFPELESALRSELGIDASLDDTRFESEP